MKTEIAKSYRDKYGWEMPTLKLARIMYEENKILFKDVQDARDFLRYIEGKKGKENRKHQNKNIPERDRNPYKLPESDETKYEPFIFSDRKSTRLNSSHSQQSRMPSSA